MVRLGTLWLLIVGGAGCAGGDARVAPSPEDRSGAQPEGMDGGPGARGQGEDGGGTDVARPDAGVDAGGDAADPDHDPWMVRTGGGLSTDAFDSLAAGRDHTCGVRSADGSAVCWGDNSFGQSSPPEGVAFDELAAGAEHTCGLVRDSGEVRCWGDNTQDQASPPADVRFLSISAGTAHNCGVANDRSMQCWGAYRGRTEPGVGPASYLAVADAAGYVCGIVAGTQILRCQWWHLASAKSPPQGVFAQITSGDDHSCAIEVGTGLLQCWGYDQHGKGTPPADAFAQVSAGAFHTCGVLAGDGSVRCWGAGAGMVTPFPHYGQSAAPSGEAFTAVSAGQRHTCGVLRDDGRVRCWGHDDFGQATPPPVR